MSSHDFGLVGQCAIAIFGRVSRVFPMRKTYPTVGVNAVERRR